MSYVVSIYACVLFISDLLWKILKSLGKIQSDIELIKERIAAQPPPPANSVTLATRMSKIKEFQDFEADLEDNATKLAWVRCKLSLYKNSLKPSPTGKFQ